jgi:phosphopantetheinyl transferase
MPVIDDLNLSPKTRLVIWEINESLQDLKSKVVLSEYSLKLINQKKSGIHKKQFLAIRNIFKVLCIDDKDLKYDEAGKPIFSQNKTLSISHSGKYAAVIISNHSVGIDIEKISDKAMKIKHKFLHVELNYPQELNNQISLVYWNIKESIYKAVGITGIDFKKNILALPLDINDAKCKSWYINNDDIYSFETYFRISKNYTLAYVIKN